MTIPQYPDSIASTTHGERPPLPNVTRHTIHTQTGERRLVLRGDIIRQIAEDHGRANPHQISKASRLSYASARRYTIDPASDNPTELARRVDVLDLTTFAALILDGVGLTWDEFAELPIGTLFALIEPDAPAGESFSLLSDSEAKA